MSEPEHYASLVVFEGPSPAEAMRQIHDNVQALGGYALALHASEALWFGVPAEELARQRHLDAKLHILLPAAEGRRGARIAQTLGPCQILTVRDVLVLGTTRIQLLGRLTDLQLGRVQSSVCNFCPEEPVLPEPTPLDIARLCVSAGQVHGGVLPTYRRGIGSEYWGPQAGLKVGEILEDDFGLARAALGEDFVRCRQEAVQFTAEFVAARRSLGGLGQP